ncbi:MAG: Crp/Fnr family transcriptional regulator [Bacteroidales bacterium]|nr:Crp/Fnr family transcriptional regulator [Bacteroidales bacterium]
MKEQLRQFLNQHIQLNDNDFHAIMDLLSEKHLRKKDHLVRATDICKELVFFTNGYFRFYYYSKSGDEITSDFYFGPGMVTSYTSFITDTPSCTYVQAMEDMKVLVLNKLNLEKLYSMYHKIDRIGRLIAEEIAIYYEQHLLSILNQTAEERYKNLLNNNPLFIQRIPLQYIASYLGITQETLSRVRQKIK